MTEVGAIVIGAGHNGMSAAATLAKQGLKVLVLEKQRYVGGMAGTTEYFKGYKHNVGAWALMVSSRSIIETLELEKHGFSTIDPPTSLCAFGDPGNTPYVLYNDPAKLAAHLRHDHGEDAVRGLEGLYEISRTFARSFGANRFKPPKSLGAVIDELPDPNDRDVMRRFLFYKSIQASLAGMAVDGTGLGSYSPGTAFSLGLHLAPIAYGVRFQLVKGGMGSISEALRRSVEANGDFFNGLLARGGVKIPSRQG